MAIYSMDRSEKRSTIFRKMLILSRRWEYLANTRLQQIGITAKQILLLGTLRREFVNPPSIGEVSEAMMTSHQNVKQIALGLERKGLLRLESDPEDKRIVRIVLLPESDERWQGLEIKEFGKLEELFKVLIDVETNRLLGMLTRLLHHAEKIDERTLLE